MPAANTADHATLVHPGNIGLTFAQTVGIIVVDQSLLVVLVIEGSGPERRLRQHCLVPLAVALPDLAFLR